MKMVKSLLLGTLAGMIACAAANASDSQRMLPVKDHPGMFVPVPTPRPYVQANDKPVKGDAYIPMGPVVERAFYIGHTRPAPLISAEIVIFGPMKVAEGAGLSISPGGGVIGHYPDTQEGDAPACYLKEAYRVSFRSGVGIDTSFQAIDYDHGA